MLGHLQSILLIQRIYNPSLSHFQEFEKAHLFILTCNRHLHKILQNIPKPFSPLKRNFKHLEIILFYQLVSASNYCSGPLSEALGKIQMEMSLAGAF